MAYLFCIARKSAAFIAHSTYESAVVFAVDAKREQGSRAGAGREEEPDRAGQPDNTAQAKNGLVPAGDQAVPGGIQQKCLSFSKAA